MRIFLFLLILISFLNAVSQNRISYRSFSDSCLQPDDIVSLSLLSKTKAGYIVSEDSVKLLAEFLKRNPLLSVWMSYPQTFDSLYTLRKLSSSEKQQINLLLKKFGAESAQLVFPLEYSRGKALPKTSVHSSKKIVITKMEMRIATGSRFPYKNPPKDRFQTAYQVSDIVKMPEILYDLGKANLWVQSLDSLNIWADFILAHPDFMFEIANHTDSRGDEKSNTKLSWLRARACYEYLVNQKKISAAVLKFNGYGESQMIVGEEEIKKFKTIEETEPLHQQNRRTELRIVAKTCTR